MSTKSNKLTFQEKFAYGLGDTGANVYCAIISTFLTAYYTDTAGIAAAAIGTMMLLARVFDGVTDLAMGAIVDKTNTKWGKARPWVLWTAPLMAIGMILMLNVPDISSGGKLIYAYITYIFMNCIVYTMNNLPYNALLARMTLDVQDRASTTSIRFVMTQLMTLLINAITANLVASVGWTKLSVAYGLLTAILMVFCFLGCKEHIGADSESGEVKVEEVPLSKALPAMLHNKYFFIQTLIFCILYVTVCASAAMGYYYCNIVLNNVALVTFVSMASTVPAILTNLILPKLVGALGKQRLMIVSAILMVVGGVIVGLGNQNFTVIMLGLLLRGFGQGPLISCAFATVADIVDYGEWKTGIRSEGLGNSCTSFGMKVGIGLGSAAATWVLAFGSYDGTLAVQAASAVSAIRFGFGFLNAIIAAVVLVLCLMMDVDKYMDQVSADLTVKHAAK
ncbi:MAG: glycoside-pentoside-hexuronide (GPH):cation symporter [Lachnospiraceae bacterium]|nr:glycoside-pentoside-hexuronide (GPH):cation symporter [Lachnospiraceae bacterium]